VPLIPKKFLEREGGTPVQGGHVAPRFTCKIVVKVEVVFADGDRRNCCYCDEQNSVNFWTNCNCSVDI